MLVIVRLTGSSQTGMSKVRRNVGGGLPVALTAGVPPLHRITCQHAYVRPPSPCRLIRPCRRQQPDAACSNYHEKDAAIRMHPPGREHGLSIWHTNGVSNVLYLTVK